MKPQNTGVEERDQWRERILSALKDLRGDESSGEGVARLAPPAPQTTALRPES